MQCSNSRLDEGFRCNRWCKTWSGPTGLMALALALAVARPMTFPAVALYPTDTTNPYVGMIRDGLVRAGYRVYSWNLYRANPVAIAALHLHWLEGVAMGRLARRSLLVTHLLFWKLERDLRRIRRRGGRIVWTAHNAQPHEHGTSRRARLVARWVDRIVAQVDTAISLSRAAIPLVRQNHATLRAPIAVIPHQNYRGHYPPGDRARGRHRFGLPVDARVIAMIGLVRPYKNVEQAIALFATLEDERTWLLVAGDCFDAGLEAQIRELATRTPRVAVHLGHLPDADFADAHAAADLVLSMQQALLNSGSVMAALSLGRPVLASPAGSLPELAEHVGDHWLALRAPLGVADIRAALDRGIPAGEPDLSHCDVGTIITRHLDVYGGNSGAGGAWGRGADDGR
jgi:glycosyltransferase involved in cell wall biosynthesis